MIFSCIFKKDLHFLKTPKSFLVSTLPGIKISNCLLECTKRFISQPNHYFLRCFISIGLAKNSIFNKAYKNLKETKMLLIVYSSFPKSFKFCVFLHKKILQSTKKSVLKILRAIKTMFCHFAHCLQTLFYVDWRNFFCKKSQNLKFLGELE